jgi:uncharacterized protein (TIGR00369 family)
MHHNLERCYQDFAKQPFMATLGATMTEVAVGTVTIELPCRPSLTQQHGFIHAGALSSALDTACGFAALSTLPAERSVLTAEFKINLLKPAVGACAVVRGRVLKTGRTLVVAQASAHMVGADSREEPEPCAVMTATVAAVAWTPDVVSPEPVASAPHVTSTTPRE